MYALEPMAVGTAMTESLSSYIIRLAEAHSVTLGDFIGRMLAKIPNPKGTLITHAASASRAGSHGFRACSYAINGAGERTAKWAYALEAATGRSDLRHLLFSRSASHCRTRYSVPIGRGVRLVRTIGAQLGRPPTNHWSGLFNNRPAARCTSSPFATLVIIAAAD